MANSNSLFNHHNIELLTAALPYMNPSVRQSVQVVAKAEELHHTMHSPESAELSAQEVKGTPDMEGMLHQLKGFCNKREQDFVDTILNYMMAQRLFHSYRSFMSTKKPAENGSGNPSDYMMEFLLSQLSNEQKGNFENMSMMFNTMNQTH